MQDSIHKSKQVLQYLYCYSIEKASFEVLQEVLPYGKIGQILWEIGCNIYEIMSNASEEDRSTILNEIQQASNEDIERLCTELSNDRNVIYPVTLSEEERKNIAKSICQTLRQIPNQKANSKQILKIINQELFAGHPVISIHHLNNSHAKEIACAIVRTLVNGNGSELNNRRNPNSNHQNQMQILEKYPKIDGFEIKGILGKGAYSKVYLANEELSSGKWRTCALKVGILENEERFKREVQNMKMVDHPHVLNCWQTGRFQEQGMMKYWISMPNMGGVTLEDLISGNSLDLETKLLILMQIADGLDALHQKRIIHRDLKPSNCLISSNFEIKISDFGLSKNLNHNIVSSQSQNANTIGTPAYMSPENIEGVIGYYSDVWAFGMIAFELLTNNLPWGRNINPLILIANIIHKDIDVVNQLNNLNLPSDLVNIIDQCLKRDASQRYQDGTELRNAFNPIAKLERNRSMYNRFKESWLILIDKNLIERFTIEEVQSGHSTFELDAFLNMPEVINLPLALDVKRLNEVFDELSKLSLKIDLKQVLDNDVKLSENLERLMIDRNNEIERIDQEITASLKQLPHSEITQMLAQFSEQRESRKQKVEFSFKASEEKILCEKEMLAKIIDEKKMLIREKLKQEIIEELKDFDQKIIDDKNKSEEFNLVWFWITVLALIWILSWFIGWINSIVSIMFLLIYLGWQAEKK